jgi:hypothetical protein
VKLTNKLIQEIIEEYMAEEIVTEEDDISKFQESFSLSTDDVRKMIQEEIINIKNGK